MNYFATGELLPAEDKPKRRNDEEKLQRDVVQFLRLAAPFDLFWFAVPNGGLRHRKVASKLVGQGLRAGVPDICCVHAGRAILIELKTPRGALSAMQKQVHAKLHCAGAVVLVCRSVEGVQNSLMELGVPLQARVAA